MSEDHETTPFEKLGVDMSSRDMQVLKALAELTSRNPEGVPYTELSIHLIGKGIMLSKVWIYKCLSRLENEGYLVSERISNPRLYKTSEDIIAEALEKKRVSRIDQLKTDREEIGRELKSVKDTSVEDLTMMAYDTIVGSIPIDSSTVIEGIENVRSTLIREIFRKAKPGDIIRTIAPIQAIDRGEETSGVTEFELLMTAAEGIKLCVILVPTEDVSRDPKVMSKYIGGSAELLQQVMVTGNLAIRSPRTPLKTYRMVALNEDMMLLYLTHSPASDMAALVRREDNPGLVNDALNTFNRIWEEGVDIIQMVSQLLEASKLTDLMME
ncbi:MAG: hypothetical protein ACFFER_02150 [Candidatus Thorarchaeota archaeon]